MKQFFKMFFASMLAIIITSIIVFFIIVGLIVGVTKAVTDEPETVVKSNSILVIDVSNGLHEQAENNSFAAFSDENAFTPGLYDIIKTIAYAKTDKNIKGIYLKLSGAPHGWATLQQLREALADFKTGNKFIYAYGEVISQKSYYLATVADNIFLNPVGNIEIKGLSAEMPFFKGTLEMLEIQPEIFYAGKFKSATEPFRAEKISEPNRIQISKIQNDIWAEFLQAIAQHAGADTAFIHQLAVAGAVQFPSDALKYKLVDGLVYWDEVEQKMRTKLGKKEEDKINYVTVEDYASFVKSKRKMNDQKIAILFAEGGITDGKSSDDYQIASKDFIEEIRKIKKNDKIKAVVLRINSPGGSALASEIILRELQLLRAKKPIIVSMGDVTASGGYYISCQADSIFALPTTITGSIGVFTILFNAENLLKNKLGITFDQVKNAPYADFPTVTRPLNADESKKMQASVDTIYSIFKRRVAKARNMSEIAVDSIGQGRVWTGKDAMKLGLVDGLGGLERAIASASRKANLKEYQVVTYPEPVDKFKSLMKKLSGMNVNAANMKFLMERELGNDNEFIRQVKALYYANGRTQMAMPYSVKIK